MINLSWKSTNLLRMIDNDSQFVFIEDFFSDLYKVFGCHSSFSPKHLKPEEPFHWSIAKVSLRLTETFMWNIMGIKGSNSLIHTESSEKL